MRRWPGLPERWTDAARLDDIYLVGFDSFSGPDRGSNRQPDPGKLTSFEHQFLNIAVSKFVRNPGAVVA